MIAGMFGVIRVLPRPRVDPDPILHRDPSRRLSHGNPTSWLRHEAERRSCPNWANGEIPGPRDARVMSATDPHRSPPSAPLGRDVVGWRVPGFRYAPPWAITVRRVAAGDACAMGDPGVGSES